MENKKFMSDIQPFKMCEKLYFVGAKKVSVHMLDTTEGLVLIDAGFPDMCEQIFDSIRYLGFDPKDICAIVHSHGHLDHFGCTQEIVEKTGAKTYISCIDNDIVNGKLDLSWAIELGWDRLPPFDCDVLIDDGDVLTFGDMTIRCVLTPGHTDGTLSFFIPTKDNGKDIIAAMHGGTGVNTLDAQWLKSYGLSMDCRVKYRESLHKLAKEHVDLVLGNHPYQNKTEDKLQQVLNGQSAVDPEEWLKFLTFIEDNFDKMLEKEKQGK